LFLLAKGKSIESIGGLIQQHFVEEAGNRAIPYRRWVDSDDHSGTYVDMQIDDSGAWLQIYEPTRLGVPLRFPGESDLWEEEVVNFVLANFRRPICLASFQKPV
jgi:hypothetical protein